MESHHVDFKHAVLNHIQEHQTFYDLRNLIQRIPDFEKLKLDPELTLFVCKAVENIVKKVNKIDKKSLVTRVIKEVFHLTDAEADIVGNQIEFLFNNGKIIKSSIIKKIRRGLLNWTSKKLL